MLEEIKCVQQNAQLLHDHDAIEQAIDKMTGQIAAELADKNPLLLCALKGGIMITGQLLLKLNFPLTVDVINVSRYGRETTGGEINWLQKPSTDLADRTVLIIDDILDEGLTLEKMIEYCRQQKAKCVYSAVLVDKKLSKSKPVQADFVGLEVEDHYLFGYGMDYKGYLRNLPGIYACQESQ